jgi:hypothetical protein
MEAPALTCDCRLDELAPFNEVDREAGQAVILAGGAFLCGEAW